MTRNATSALALLLAGCGNSNVTTDNATTDALAAAERRIESLEGRMSSLQTDVISLRLKTSDENIFLSPTDDGFSSVRSSFGDLAISVEDVAPYASGSKVTLDIGNLTSANVVDLKMKVEWGRKDDLGKVEELGQSKDETFLGLFPAGTWRRVTVNLSDVPPQELNFIELSNISSGSIRLHRIS